MAIIRMRDHLYDEIVNYAKEHLPEEARQMELPF